MSEAIGASTSELPLDTTATLVSASTPEGSHLMSKWGPRISVLAVVVFQLVELKPELIQVPYPNDSSLHEQMVRYATLQFRSGHFPLEGWYPYLGLGSPQFLHYQSLGAMLTGALGLAIGPNHAFNLTLYLLLAIWPVSVYLSARLLRLTPWMASIAAICAPFVTSVIGVGYEQTSYLWVGYGVWSQLWAMWTLPIAWALVFRALENRRYIPVACLLVMCTIAFHFETGYLAVLSIIVLPFVALKGELKARVLNALLLLIGTAALSAWVVYPVIHFGSFASINEFLANGPDANSYGARKVLSWLVTGRIFDANRLPVLTVLVCIGIVFCAARWRRDRRARAVLVLFCCSLVLFFGRSSLGRLLFFVPGSHDLFLRRFIIGVQLSGLLLAGYGAASLIGLIGSLPALKGNVRRIGMRRCGVSTALAIGVAVFYLSPAWLQITRQDRFNNKAIHYQENADAFDAGELDTLIARVQDDGGGRVYAGLTTNWGEEFTIGYVPVLKYLASKDVDEVGYTLRTASLMTDPEAYFDEDDPGDYDLFGIRYLILPEGHPPALHARELEQQGPYVLWELPQNHYIQVVDTKGHIVSDRADLGSSSAAFLRSVGKNGPYPTVAFNGQPAAPATLSGAAQPAPAGPPGSVIHQSADLVEGTASATVDLRRKAVVLLKVSFDPGWQARVDGKPAHTEMIAPALLGVVVPAGRHYVTFAYHSFGYYWLLFTMAGLCIAVFIGLAISGLWRRGPEHRTDTSLAG